MLAVEELESRLAPSVNVSFVGPNLVITDPSPTPNELVTISQNVTPGVLQLNLNLGVGSDTFTTTTPAAVSLPPGGKTALIDTNGAPIQQLLINLTQQNDEVLFNSLDAVGNLKLGGINVQQATAVQVNGILKFGGPGGVTMNASNPTPARGGIDIAFGAGIITDGGAIWLSGVAPTTGSNLAGIGLSGGSLTTNTGKITLNGTGVASLVNDLNDAGVLLRDGAKVTSNSGGISITGTGGSGSGGSNDGVEITDPGTLISSTISGDIEIFGTGGGTGDSNSGVLMQYDAVISSAGAGKIVVQGAGSYYGSHNNVGVVVAGADQPTTITSSTGDISIEGSGGSLEGSGSNNQGVLLELGAQVTSTGTVPGSSANIKIDGLGGDGAQDNQGVRLIGNPGGPTTEVVSAEGKVVILGTGGNGTAGQNHNNGVQLEAGALVQATDQGALSIFGSCAESDDSANVGVELTDPGTLVTATFGAIDIEGIGPDFGTGAANLGVLIQNGAQVTSTGVGSKVADILIVGTGGVGTDNGYGIALLGSAAGTPAVTTVDGNIILFGSGDGFGNNNIGVYLSQGIVQSTGIGSFGSIILNGGSCGCGADGNSGVVLVNASSVTSVDATIDVEGFGEGSGAKNDGVDISQSTIDTTGSGDLTVHGEAATSGGTGIGVLIQQDSTVGKDGSGSVDIEGIGTSEIDIQWDDLTVQKTGGSYTFDGSTLSTSSLVLQSGPYTAAINAGSLGITFQGLLEVDSGVPLTFTAAEPAQLGTVTTVLGQVVAVNGVQVNPGLLQGTGDVNAPILVTAGGTVAPGLPGSTGILTGAGATTFLPGSTFAVRLNGLTPGTGYDQLDLTDPTIAGSTLDLSVSTTAPAGTTFTILHSLTPIVGTFAGLAEGTVFERNGRFFQITYQGGAGDDIVLTMLDPPVNGLNLDNQGIAGSASNSLLFQILLGLAGGPSNPFPYRIPDPTGSAALLSFTASELLQDQTGGTALIYGASDDNAESVITGVVEGGEEDELAGETVVLEQRIRGIWVPVRQTTLDEKGTFSFDELPAGTYRVEPRLKVGQLVPEAGDGIIHLGTKDRAQNRLKLVRPSSQEPQTAPPDLGFASWPTVAVEETGPQPDDAEELS
jgi:hypothetical protein